VRQRPLSALLTLAVLSGCTLQVVAPTPTPKPSPAGSSTPAPGPSATAKPTPAPSTTAEPTPSSEPTAKPTAAPTPVSSFTPRPPQGDIQARPLGLLDGLGAGVPFTGDVVIADARSLAAFYRLVGAQATPVPAVDFANERVVALFNRREQAACAMVRRYQDLGDRLTIVDEPMMTVVAVDCSAEAPLKRIAFGLVALPHDGPPVVGAKVFAVDEAGVPKPDANAPQGAYTLTFDPPLRGDSGLTPNGVVTGRDVALSLTLKSQDRTVTGEASWCPSDYCHTATVTGLVSDGRITLNIAKDVFRDRADMQTTLIGQIDASGTIAGEANVYPSVATAVQNGPSEIVDQQRRFKLTRRNP